jgi:DNA replication protein DnaC
VLDRQVAAREASGTANRIAAAHFPAVKTLEDFNFDYRRFGFERGWRV